MKQSKIRYTINTILIEQRVKISYQKGQTYIDDKQYFIDLQLSDRDS